LTHYGWVGVIGILCTLAAVAWAGRIRALT
jgi:hypothetical protein